MNPNSKKESRQLPCFTWISTGECMYRNKCTYLHSPDLKHSEKKISFEKNSMKPEKGDHVDDTFFLAQNRESFQ